MSQDCAVCYVSDINFMLPSLVSAKGLRRYVPADKVDIYIFAIDIEPERAKAITSYVAADAIRVVAMSSRHLTGVGWERTNKTHVPVSCLGRFFLDSLLPERTERIVYLDGDTLIMRDPTSLIATTFPEGKLAAVEDISFFCCNDMTAHGRFVKAYFRGLGIDGTKGYFNSGVLAAGRSTWRMIATEALRFFLKNPELCKYHDQSALNAIIGNRRLRLSPAWNFQTPYRYWGVDQVIQPAIYHFTQAHKPWMGPMKPWSELFPLYEKEMTVLGPLGLPTKRRPQDEIDDANVQARRVLQKLKWVYPARLWLRKKKILRLAENSIDLKRTQL